MATSLDIVNAAYRNLYRAAPTSDATAVITQSVSFLDNPPGSVVANDITNFVSTATATTAVAVMSYGFFTGVTLGTAGLDYLLSPTGANPNNLNSAYYAAFSTENRYINFAKNLGAVGDGATMFAATYGSLTLAQTVAKAYQLVFGTAISADYAASTLLGVMVPDGRGGTFTRADYFASYGGDGLTGQGTKAAAVGWLMSEAAKAHTGPLYSAAQSYMTDLAVDGQAQFGVNLLGTYGVGGAYAIGGPNDPGLPGRVFTITADNEVFISTGQNVQYVSQYGQDYSTSGNDVVTSTTGLSPTYPYTYSITSRAVNSVGVNLRNGNDTLTVTGGFAAAQIDLGAGNDVASFSAFNGVLTTGAGYDRVYINTFSSQGVYRNGVAFTPEITDLTHGQDVLTIGAASGAGHSTTMDVRAAASFDSALATIAAATAAGANTVFEYAGSTYVFHQNGDPAVNIGAATTADGLLKLTGLIGATVGAAGGSGDILFGG